MAKKAELQERIKALGIEPGDMTIAQMEKIIADNAPESGDSLPQDEDLSKTNEFVNNLEVDFEEAEEVEEVSAPVKKSMFNREPSFIDKISECVQKCTDFLNKGGDEKAMKAYLKGLSK